MKAFLYLTLTACLLTACKSPPKQEPIDDLVAQLREKLPKGWSVVWEPEYSFLSICKNEMTEGYSPFPNTSIPKKVTTGQYCFAFRIGDKVSEVEYQQLIRQNQKINKELAVIYDQLVARRVSHKFDSFIPDNDDDRAIVTLYNDLKEQRNSLPDFHFSTLSLTWIFGGTDSELFSVVDQKIRMECHAVRADITSLLSSYPDH